MKVGSGQDNISVQTVNFYRFSLRQIKFNYGPLKGTFLEPAPKDTWADNLEKKKNPLLLLLLLGIRSPHCGRQRLRVEDVVDRQRTLFPV